MQAALFFISIPSALPLSLLTLVLFLSIDSYQRGTTFNFNLGVGEVIKGIDIGMEGMCKGERRKIILPKELGYGDRAVGKLISSHMS